MGYKTINKHALITTNQGLNFHKIAVWDNCYIAIFNFDKKNYIQTFHNSGWLLSDFFRMCLESNFYVRYPKDVCSGQKDLEIYPSSRNWNLKEIKICIQKLKWLWYNLPHVFSKISLNTFQLEYDSREELKIFLLRGTA